MSETPVVVSRRNLPRNELAKLFGANPRMLKAFEDILIDVTQTLPEAIGKSTEDASSVLGQHVFSRQIPPAPPVYDGASQVLAAQIFGA